MSVTVIRSILLAAVISAAAGPVLGGDLRLLDATKRRDAPAVQSLLKGGVDVNEAYGDGATALHWAVLRDDLAIAKLLIAAGAKVNATNDLGVTPLIMACVNRSASMVETLLKSGADPNAGPTGEASAVMEAARTGSAEVMALLLAHGGNQNAKETTRGQTALMWAASAGHPDVVRLLVEHGADVNAKTKEESRAVAYGARALASKEANGFTPLLFAARVGDLESARILVKAGANPNATASDGHSALVLATVRGHAPVAMFLLEAGANPNADGAGFAALHWAAGSWESELTTRAVNVARGGEWSTAAGFKAGEKLTLVKALLAHGADPNLPVKKTPPRAGSSTNEQLAELVGATPLIIAATAGATDVMKELVKGAANPDATTKAKGTLLMAAAGLGRVPGEVIVPESDTLAAARLALELGADINAADAAGNTALHYAAYMRRDSIIRFLVEKGASLEVTNRFGETPLWVSEVNIQYAGGNVAEILQSSSGDLLRSLGARAVKPQYKERRPSPWPGNPGQARDPADARGGRAANEDEDPDKN